jgi:hypothetical protein
MKIAGYTDFEEISRVRTERKKRKRIPSRSKEVYYETETDEELPEINLSNEAWMNGNVMSLISEVLSQLHTKFNL